MCQPLKKSEAGAIAPASDLNAVERQVFSDAAGGPDHRLSQIELRWRRDLSGQRLAIASFPVLALIDDLAEDADRLGEVE